MIIRDLEIPVNKWYELLRENPHSTPFQTPEFFRLVQDISGLSAHACAVETDGRLSALAVTIVFSGKGLTGYFSRRGIIYGGPLVQPGETDALSSLLEVIVRDNARRAIYLEARNYSDYGTYGNLFAEHGWSYVPYLDIRIETGNREAMNSAISSSRRRQIRKAAGSGAEIKEASSMADVETFYKMLHDHYRKRVRKPLMPIEFFRSAFIKQFGRFLLVWYQNRVIGGIYCPVLERHSIYEFYICGLDQEFRDQYPSVMATWAAMEYACLNGIGYFDLMGAGPPDRNYGVRDFKARFGGRQVEYGRFLKVNNRILYYLGKTGIKIIGKLSVNEGSD